MKILPALIFFQVSNTDLYIAASTMLDIFAWQ